LIAWATFFYIPNSIDLFLVTSVYDYERANVYDPLIGYLVCYCGAIGGDYAM